MPYCFRSGRDDLVVYCCGSPLISMLSKTQALDALQRDFERFGAHPIVRRKMHGLSSFGC